MSVHSCLRTYTRGRSQTRSRGTEKGAAATRTVFVNYTHNYDVLNYILLYYCHIVGTRKYLLTFPSKKKLFGECYEKIFFMVDTFD